MELFLPRKRVRRWPIIFLGFRLTLAGGLLAQDSLTISMVVQEVLAKNDRVTAARFMEQSALENIGSSGSWDDPMLMIGVVNLPTSFDFKMDPMTMKMVGISQKIPIAGQKGLEKKASRAEAEAAKFERLGMEVDLALAGRLAFADLYYKQKTLGEIRSQRQLTESLIEAALARLRTDQAAQSDVSAAQADLWRLESDILALEQEVQSASNNLSALMGRDPQQTLPPLAAPNIALPPATADDWVSRAGENYPALGKLQNQSQSYLHSSAAARRMRWPMLELSAEYGFRSDTEMEERDDMVGFQINFSLPLFAGRKQGNMARAMAAMQKSTEAEAVQLTREIEAQLRTLHSQTQKLIAAIELYEKRVLPADQDAIQSALAGYSANRLPFATVLSYAITLYRDRITLNQLRLEQALGMISAEQYFADPQTLSGQTPRQ